MGRFVRFLECNVSDPIFDRLQFFPNITGIHANGLEPCHIDTLLQLARIRQFVYTRAGVRWKKQDWGNMSKAWQVLETLELRAATRFRPNSVRAPLHELALLHTLKWRNCPRLSPNSIPYIRPHTLRTIVLDGVERVKKGFFEVLIGEHAQSLQRLQIERCGELLRALIPVHEAQRLEYLTAHTRTYDTPVELDDQLPASLIEISLDDPEFSAVQALKFLRQRSGGPLKRLSVFIYSVGFSDWERVRLEALELGIMFYVTKTVFQFGREIEG